MYQVTKCSLLLVFFTLTLPNFSSAGSRDLFYSVSESKNNLDHSSNYFKQSNQAHEDTVFLRKAFSKFIFSLLKKDIETDIIDFDDETNTFLKNPTSLKGHVKVKPGDIIDPVNSFSTKSKKLWVKPYVRDVYFQTRTMVCKYSYRSKFRKPRKSLSGHFIHENHGALNCKDINNGARVTPYIFGNKSWIFTAELLPQNSASSFDKIISFKVNDSRRNKTYY